MKAQISIVVQRVLLALGVLISLVVIFLLSPLAVIPIILAAFLCLSLYKKQLTKSDSVNNKKKLLYGVAFLGLSGTFFVFFATIFLFVRSYNNSSVTQQGMCEQIYEPMREQILQGGWEWKDFGRTREEYETLEKKCR